MQKNIRFYHQKCECDFTLSVEQAARDEKTIRCPNCDVALPEEVAKSIVRVAKGATAIREAAEQLEPDWEVELE